MPSPRLTYLDVRLCNCASCGRDLVGRSMARLALCIVPFSLISDSPVRLPEAVFGRLPVGVRWAPFCRACHRVEREARVLRGSA